MGQRLDILLRMGADMKIREGAYYRTRDGDVVGPMRRVDLCDATFTAGDLTWNEDGSYVQDITYKMDLISEVYVSDTPPVPQVNTTKTAREELVEKAALAILKGHYANPDSTSGYGFAEIWLAAEHFVEARTK